MQKTGSTADANKNAADMVEMAYAIAAADEEYKGLDAVLIAGDMGEGRNLQQYDDAHEAITKNIDFDETALLAIMGNHEYYHWRWETNVDSLSGTYHKFKSNGVWKGEA